MNTRKARFLNFIKKYSKKKRTWVILAVVVIFLIFILKPANTSVNIITDTARYVDLKQTVLATGQVTSNTDLDLSFNSSGIVKSLKVKVGDNVKKGDILATIDQGGVLATLTQARGALGAAQARLKRILENEEVKLAQVNYDQAKITQDLLVKNAYNKMLNSTPEAVSQTGNGDYNSPTISGTYNLGKEGAIKIKIYASGSDSGYSFSLSGLVEGSGNVTTNTSVPLANSGLYIKFPTTNVDYINDWVINIPNEKASDYLANYNSYQEALATSQSELDKRGTELALKKAKSQGSDIDLAQADITSAEGQLQAAQSKYEDTIIRAPEDGTITNIDIKLGELSEVQKPVITLQDISNLYIEAKINESSIANVRLGQKVSMTFDAFGSSRKFDGTVVHIDPSATTTDGIVNYKVKSSITTIDSAIRSGMNADISILTAEKQNVLVIPKAAIITKDGMIYVNIITDKKHKKYQEQKIETGLLGDGNLIEVKSGLSDGDQIAIISK
jgi:HlyD family secretion protein